MKKIIALLLTLSLLLCMNAIAFAAEGDDGGNEPITTVGDAPETSVESSTESEADPTEDTNEAEIFAPAEQSDESETSDPAAESGTSETTEPTDESNAPEGDASIGDSEASQEPTGNEAEGNMQPANNAEPVSDGEMLDEPAPVDNEVHNIKIEWKGLVFTYHEATRGRWDPNNEGGPAWVDPQPAHWTSSDPTNNDCGTLTITSQAEADTVKVSIKFTPDTQWGAYKVGLAISEVESKVTTDQPDNDSLYWTASQTFDKTVSKGQTETVYVRPGVSTDTLSNATFTAASDGSPVLFGNITVSVTVDFNDPEYPQGPEIFD